METDLLRAKILMEKRLGRPMEPDELNLLRGQYYFGKSYRPAEQKSKPQPIGDILPGVMENIRSHCNRRRKKHGLPLLGPDGTEISQHGSRVLKATVDFMQSRPGRRQPRKVKR